MSAWWRPSLEWFGQRVSKTVLAHALTEIGQDGLAIRVRAAKKLEAARLAIPALADAGWLPAPLRSRAWGLEPPDECRPGGPGVTAADGCEYAPISWSQRLGLL